MELLVLLIFIAVVIFLVLVLMWKRWIKKFDAFKFRPTTLFLGHTLMFPKEPTELLILVRDCLLEGDYDTLFLLGPHSFFISAQPKHAEILLSSNKSITKSYEYSFLEPWLGTGLLLSTGSKWKKRRRLLTPAFHYGILEDFAEVFQEQAKIFVDILQPFADSGETFNICKYATNCTLDIICETAMGVNCGTQYNCDAEYPRAVLSMCAALQTRQVRAYLWPDFIYNLCEAGRKHNHSIKILHDFTMKVIKDKVQKRKEQSQDSESKKRLSFIDILIENYERGEIDLDGLREEVDTFMFEGHDTTASGIFWTLYLLGRHPEALRKVQEEVDEVWDNRGGKSLVEVAKDLQYLTCVVKESLRLFPPVPLIARIVNEDVDVGEGRVLPAGSSFGIAPFLLHRNHNFWENPDDFMPERFLLENSVKRHPFAYVPFSAGPRNCIGQKFALLEEKIVLSQFLRRFNVTSLQSPEDLDLSAEIILRTQSGLSVKISNRK